MSTKIHQDEQDWSKSDVAVKRGETIDFLADIDEILNNDQFLWKVTVENRETANATKWDSALDFSVSTERPLNKWEQLAQVLLCTNEFLFID